DPEGTTNTTDKEIELQPKRTIGINKDGVWISNEFNGARMNDFYKVSDSLYRVVIEPERHPVNNSPWYAFKIWSDTAKTVRVQLSYKHGQHRYTPNLSRDGQHWHSIDRSEEHTSELQSRFDLVCRLLLEKKNKQPTQSMTPTVRPSQNNTAALL